jgi:hypothetical protein
MIRRQLYHLWLAQASSELGLANFLSESQELAVCVLLQNMSEFVRHGETRGKDGTHKRQFFPFHNLGSSRVRVIAKARA